MVIKPSDEIFSFKHAPDCEERGQEEPGSPTAATEVCKSAELNQSGLFGTNSGTFVPWNSFLVGRAAMNFLGEWELPALW